MAKSSPAVVFGECWHKNNLQHFILAYR